MHLLINIIQARAYMPEAMISILALQLAGRLMMSSNERLARKQSPGIARSKTGMHRCDCMSALRSSPRLTCTDRGAGRHACGPHPTQREPILRRMERKGEGGGAEGDAKEVGLLLTVHLKLHYTQTT